MAFIPGLISAGVGIFGQLFGKGKKIDQKILDDAMKNYAKLFGEFGTDKNFYSNFPSWLPYSNRKMTSLKVT